MEGEFGHLRRYARILDGKALPQYLISKRWRASVPDGGDDAAMMGEAVETTASMMGRLDDPPPNEFAGGSLLDLKSALAKRTLGSCELCERSCRADRGSGAAGYCGVLSPRIASELIHLGEEPEISPSYTIFFSGCTFRCVYCQNWDISQDPGAGERVEPSVVAGWIGRRARHVKNVNWVGGDPTPGIAFILDVLQLCSTVLPQVWNSNMYMSERGMALLAGTMDVYLADLKYGNDDCARELSDAPRYWKVATRNISAARKAGELLVRHLVLPGHVECCSMPVVDWLAEHAPDAKVNIMAQYRPEYKAGGKLTRRPTMDEVVRVQRRALEMGLDLTL